MGQLPYYAPKDLNIDITTHCNLRCSYCSHFSSDGDVDTDLSLEEWKRFFKRMYKHWYYVGKLEWWRSFLPQRYSGDYSKYS